MHVFHARYAQHSTHCTRTVVSGSARDLGLFLELVKLPKSFFQRGRELQKFCDPLLTESR